MNKMFKDDIMNKYFNVVDDINVTGDILDNIAEFLSENIGESYYEVLMFKILDNPNVDYDTILKSSQFGSENVMDYALNKIIF